MLDSSGTRSNTTDSTTISMPLAAEDNLHEQRRALLLQVEAGLKNGAKEPGALKVWAEWLREKLDKSPADAA
ncbi:MAG: hypothetical protein K0U93_25945 [Gammaproteobacteria bacterium]|nr:hypothetical protein [Gammaproteobacteria bacterium]